VRIGYVIGALGRGGAELQLLQLATALTERGHHVDILAYSAPSDLDDSVRASSIGLTVRNGRSQIEKVRIVRSWLRGGGLDVVHAVLNRASSLTLMARFPSRKPPVVVTDFSSATYEAHRIAVRAMLLSYHLADRVVTETEANRESLARLMPLLRKRTRVIRNGFDPVRFTPAGEAQDERAPFRFCVVGTVYPVKNPTGVIDAIAELRRRGHAHFEVDWYGRFGLPNEDRGIDATLAYADALGVRRWITFHGDTPDIEDAYHRSDALLLASKREGFPNVVVEAMGCGLPIVVSRVSDLPLLVDEARNGFDFDPNDTSSMADAMERMLGTTRSERTHMGRRSRDVAVRWFALDRFVADHEALYRELAR
jgi:glycosyltransferase involved in cell wall biosynthesis